MLLNIKLQLKNTVNWTINQDIIYNPFQSTLSIDHSNFCTNFLHCVRVFLVVPKCPDATEQSVFIASHRMIYWGWIARNGTSIIECPAASLYYCLDIKLIWRIASRVSGLWGRWKFTFLMSSIHISENERILFPDRFSLFFQKKLPVIV